MVDGVGADKEIRGNPPGSPRGPVPESGPVGGSIQGIGRIHGDEAGPEPLHGHLGNLHVGEERCHFGPHHLTGYQAPGVVGVPEGGPGGAAVGPVRQEEVQKNVGVQSSDHLEPPGPGPRSSCIRASESDTDPGIPNNSSTG